MLLITTALIITWVDLGIAVATNKCGGVLVSISDMKTTIATWKIQVTTDEGHLSFLKDMPTRPKTQKGIKSQNNKLSKWVEKQYPNFTSYDISLLN